MFLQLPKSDKPIEVSVSGNTTSNNPEHPSKAPSLANTLCRVESEPKLVICCICVQFIKDVCRDPFKFGRLIVLN